MIVLAGVNVALGYLDAELVVAAVVVELALLVLVVRYRSRFLPGRGTHEGARVGETEDSAAAPGGESPV